MLHDELEMMDNYYIFHFETFESRLLSRVVNLKENKFIFKH